MKKIATGDELSPKFTLSDRLAHVIPAISYFILTYLYWRALGGGCVFEWADRAELFLLFKLEMFALGALGFLFIFGSMVMGTWKGKIFVGLSVLTIVYVGYFIGHWTGVWLLFYLIAVQFMSARHQVMGLIQVGLLHMGGYVFMVILVRVFTRAKGFEELTADNIIKPALVYFAVRGILELALIFIPAHWKAKKMINNPPEIQ